MKNNEPSASGRHAARSCRAAVRLALALTAATVATLHAQNPSAAAGLNATVVTLEAARSALDDKLYGLAQKQIEKFLQNRQLPEAAREEASLLLLRALCEQGKFDAIHAFVDDNKSMVRHAADRGAFTFWMAMADYRLSRFADARKALDGFDEKYPSSVCRAQADRLRARCLLAAGNRSEALAAFASFEAAHPGSPEVPGHLLDWGAALAETGSNAEARAVLARLDRYPIEQPDVQDGLYRLARLQMKEADWTGAVQRLSGLATNPAVGVNRRAEAYYAMHETAEAVSNAALSASSLTNALALAEDPLITRRVEAAIGLKLVRERDIDNGMQKIRDVISRAPQDDLSDGTQLRLAQLLLEQGRYAEAADEFQAYLDTYTNAARLPLACDGRGWALGRLGRYGESAASFLKAYETSGDPARREQSLFKVADAYFSNAQFKLASDTYTRFAAEFPLSALMPRATFQLAESLARCEELGRAEAVMQNIVETYPSNAIAEEAMVRVAEIKSLRGNLAEAVEAFSTVLATFTNGVMKADALVGRGLASYKLSLFDDALRDFHRAVGECPHAIASEQAFYMQALCHYWLGRDDEAVAICGEFISRFPNSKWVKEALFWLGEHEFNRRRHADAEARFLAFAGAYPDDELADRALLYAAASASRRKEFIRSVEIVSRMAKEYPDSTCLDEARFTQGDALCELGNFPAAILTFQEIINKYPNSPRFFAAWTRKGDCDFALGSDTPQRYRDAIASYRVVTESAGAGFDLQLQAHYKTARSLLSLDEPAGALEHYYTHVIVPYADERMKGAATGDAAGLWFAKAVYDSADILERQRDFAGAVRILERLAGAGIPGANRAADRIGKIKLEQPQAFR